jgi:ribosomal protein S8
MIFYHIADFIARLHVASCKYLYTVSVIYNKVNLRLLILFNIEGIIEGFRILNDFILVFLKYSYFNIFMLFKNVTLFSTPGRRVF